jgi:hypothetical protein
VITVKFPSKLRRTNDGQWSLRHEIPEIGSLEVIAPTREHATEKLIREIRYRLELSPCCGESYQHIKVEIFEA